ncbi:hypothetical protein V3391_01580 [Luteimonas sp. SMYT11W]|uniref:Transposase n=1 Tax=Luteimonas flava TaxID=3115822 RepID=A0ABU7WAB7_9GAMM
MLVEHQPLADFVRRHLLRHTLSQGELSAQCRADACFDLRWCGHRSRAAVGQRNVRRQFYQHVGEQASVAFGHEPGEVHAGNQEIAVRAEPSRRGQSHAGRIDRCQSIPLAECHSMCGQRPRQQ